MTAKIVNPHLEGDSFYWPGGPTGILLAHGFTATTAEVRPLARILLDQGYSVAGPLLPGHKTTLEEMNRCRWQDWAGAIETAYRQMAARCERVFVGGESMGGLLALYLASQHDEVAGILAFAPAIRVRYARRVATALLAPLGGRLRAQRAQRAQARQSARVEACWQGYDVRPARAGFQLYRLARAVGDRLASIRNPLLIVQGRLDDSIDPYGAEALYRQVGSAMKELHWMEKSTHCVILDQELPQVGRLALAFIARVTAAGSSNVS